MRNLWTIMRKELARVFMDRRLVFTTILMPGLLLFVMYSLMGDAISNFGRPSDDAVNNIVVIGCSDMEGNEIDNELKSAQVGYNYIYASISEEAKYKEQLISGDVDYLMVLDSDFFTKLSKYNEIDYVKPNINLFYNPAEEKSSTLNSIMMSIVNSLESKYENLKYGDTTIFTINKDTSSEIFNENKLVGKTVSTLLPLLIIIFLFSGSMAIAPESIAGEKERGTMATLLVTPTKRSDIALGKMISLSIISILSAISSFIGIIASIPKLLGFNEAFTSSGDFAKMYQVSDYLVIFFILITTVLVIIGMISIVSALAKNIKEAGTFILPLYLLSMGVGILSMFGGASDLNPLLYLIPIYGSLQNLVSIFNFEFNILNFSLTIISNLVFTGIFILLLTKMFNSEKFMFSK